ncbi:MAG: SDR family oxidoreductase [Microbacteriaceae bacterium]|nr:SDR family oxidoreductase [Microbacteriaceae bacterium]MCL2793842.1 SDR family oxidoreductase [Microbacteriaceae bacterium]
MVEMRGGIDDVIVPVGGWWAGGPLTGITADDWQQAFTGLATAHMGLARAVLPRMSGAGAYTIVVGQSAEFPVPGSGLVSMEQTALLMLQRVLAAENPGRRVLALELGPVATRFAPGETGWVTSEQVGAVAIAASTGADVASGTVLLASAADAAAFLAAR